ncbi:ABC transporter C family member 8-like isoform X2 [Rutidosis leptorrhynchoides]|uniref:ABC transporter C family member 8-like isoform X2 n=1 Tax=Rutidosis leptorrhynchoides TaxID=125765 RepID=UPI003A98E56C
MFHEFHFDMKNSVAAQTSILDIFNLIFLVFFYLLLLVNYLRKSNTNRSTVNSNWISQSVASCCVLTSVAYLIAGLWNTTPQLHWWVFAGKSLVWLTLTVSLLVQEFTSSLKFINSVWWIFVFLSVSVVNIKSLAELNEITVLSSIEWASSIFLLLCALRNFKHFITRYSQSQTLSEPLIGNHNHNHNEVHETETRKLEEPSFLSTLTFSWVNPILVLGYRKPLVLEEIPHLAPIDQASVAHEKFKKAWDSLQTEKASNNVNMVPKALAKVYLREMILSGVCIFLRTISVIVSPLLLYAFVDYSNREIKDLHQGLLLVGCLILVKITESLSQRQFFFNARRTGMRMRSALMVAVYEKQLKLSNLGKKRHSTGEVVNYIAVDAYRMGEFPMWFHVSWSAVVQLFLAMGVLFSVVGLGVVPGLVPLIVCALLNIPFAKSMQKCQLQIMVAQDKRLRSTSEVLNNMKVIKLHCWEEKFHNLIKSLREIEFRWLRESQFKRAFTAVLYWMSPTLVSSVVFCGCVVLKSAPLNAATIFTILAALRSMAEPVRVLPDALSALIQVKVSFDRINSLLVDDELKDNRMKSNQDLENAMTRIRIQDGNFAWDPESPTPTLKNINLEVKCGQKVAVCGSVGTGKSSILYALLGELSKTSGSVGIFRSIAYVSQTSWIQSGTIQDNILYGKPMERSKYEKAIKACALDKDIEAFEHGDLTEIGQRGLNMSGGQKQRIQLARAVYNDADIYLLDDPFSAVDAHTAATLFNDCVMSCLEKKTVILVTHQVEFLSSVDNILVMQDGQVTQSGKYDDLLMAGTAFEQLVNAHKDAIIGVEPSGNTHQNDVDTDTNFIAKANSEIQLMKGLPEGVQLTEEEEKEVGNVGWKPFFDYVVISEGLFYLLSCVISQTSFVALQAAASYWLAFGIQIPKITTFMLIGVYTFLSTISTFFVFMRSFFGTLLGLKASKSVFDKFTDSIFRAPMVFFDSTPVGRILTRASSDLSVVDFDIPVGFIYVVGSGLELLAIIFVMASVTWQVLIVAVLGLAATKYVQGYYQPTARELMRINGTTKAPVMNYASETSLGVATIRAFKMQDRFFKDYLKLVDTDASTFMFSNATLEWLVLRIETLANVTLFIASFLLVLLPKGFVPSGLVGLSLSYALTLSGTQVFFTRWYCSLDNYVISVERIKQFMHISPEPPAIVDNNRPPSSWPSKGTIQFQNLKLRYRPNAPLVLKGISCTFKEGTRVGIVGRTGSGKTTLITALFRLVEPESGKILIDGLDICSIGLKDLRLKLSVIPQEPTLFKGSIRTNLDPLGLHSDDEIWKALDKCQLKSTITSLPNLLDSSVSDEGENWSAGQRQLFCLGRVLLMRNKILVLDEATASIDSATDAVLQRIIREEFSNCTVITVAHRVPTVIDSDRVMVLSFGKMVEYDEPSKLMETNTFFSKLVAEYWSSCKKNSAQRFE